MHNPLSPVLKSLAPRQGLGGSKARSPQGGKGRDAKESLKATIGHLTDGLAMDNAVIEDSVSIEDSVEIDDDGRWARQWTKSVGRARLTYLQTWCSRRASSLKRQNP